MNTLSKLRKIDIERQAVVSCEYKGFSISLAKRPEDHKIMVKVYLRGSGSSAASIFVAELLCDGICYAKDFASLAVNALLEHMDMAPKSAIMSLTRWADAFDGWNKLSAQRLLELCRSQSDGNRQHTLAEQLKDEVSRLQDRQTETCPILDAEHELREMLKAELDEASITTIIHAVGREMSLLSDELIAKRDEIEALSQGLNAGYDGYVMAIIQDAHTEYEELSAKAEEKLTKATLIQQTITSRVQQLR
ncbi:hypothetical protein IC617_09290 [Neiella sp. HB171785]|uniref:Uncharacterized protein n=1 Tax=Neiella litorisoli TaxID=2771431 RepID=A0A8J6QUX2_9GAMM|nr:hypothetical protein [Neiella litorisoli]MBD1389623.1 hypothetical protein [Neiella litorisoli]